MAASACRAFFCRLFAPSSSGANGSGHGRWWGPGGWLGPFRRRSATASPSQVRFLPCPCGLLTFDPVTRDAWLERLEESYAMAGDEPPRLQVAESGGQWFALNNAHLAALRELERRGRCSKVVLNVVPLARVPPLVRRAMKLSSASYSSSNSSNSNSLHQDAGSLATSEAWATPTPGQRREIVTALVKRPAPPFPSPHHVGATVSTVDGTLLNFRRNDSPMYDGSSPWEGEDETTTTNTTDEESDEFSDDLEDEEGVGEEEEGCGVCDRYFATEARLLRHQRRRGHFGCSFCDATLPTSDELAIHQLAFHPWLTEPRADPPPPLPGSTPSSTPKSSHLHRVANNAKKRHFGAKRNYHHNTHAHRQMEAANAANNKKRHHRAHARTTRDEMESLL